MLKKQSDMGILKNHDDCFINTLSEVFSSMTQIILERTQGTQSIFYFLGQFFGDFSYLLTKNLQCSQYYAVPRDTDCLKL